MVRIENRVKRASGAGQRVLVGVAVAVCIAPAAAINAQYGLSEGRSPAHIAGMIGLVLGAALAGLALERARLWRQRLPALLCLSVFVACNIANALGLVASHRADGQSGAKTEIATRESLTARKVRVSSELGAGRVRDPNALQAEIARAKVAEIYRRSKSCSDVTLADSRAWCSDLFSLEAELKTAQHAAELRVELDGVERELRGVKEVVAIDAQAEGLAKLFSMSPQAAGLLVDVITAIGVELLAAFGPMLIIVVVTSPREAPIPGPDGLEPADTGETSAVPSPEDALAAFIAGMPAAAAWAPNTAIAADYRAHCKGTGAAALSQHRLSAAIEAAGFERRKLGGRLQWRSRERGPRLAATRG